MNMPALKYSQIHQGFYTFINEDVLPTCGIEVNVFWQAIERMIADYSSQPNEFIDEQHNSQLAANTRVAPVVDRQQLIQATNSKWTSFFDATNFSDEDTEISSKAYLDKHFPLATGSHSDVKNYVVYYHHLLAFFDDGSQSGLANPSEFVALCGHKCSPDSIVLKQSKTGLHLEIVFDRKGNRGTKDAAGIEDILVESNDCIIIDFNAVQIDGESKIQAYRNLQSYLRGDLKTVMIANGQQTICRMNNDVTFTDVNGEDYCIENQSVKRIRCANPALVTEFMCDSKGALAPQVIIDAVVASLMLRKAQGANKPESLLLERGGFTPKMMERIEEIFQN